VFRVHPTFNGRDIPTPGTVQKLDRCASTQCRNAVGWQRRAHLKFIEVQIGLQNKGSVVTKMKFMQVRIRKQNIGSEVTNTKLKEIRIRMQNIGSVVTKTKLKFGLRQCLYCRKVTYRLGRIGEFWYCTSPYENDFWVAATPPVTEYLDKGTFLRRLRPCTKNGGNSYHDEN
jgi:hypothetical protein